MKLNSPMQEFCLLKQKGDLDYDQTQVDLDKSNQNSIANF